MSAPSAYGTSAMVAPVAGLLTGWSEREAGLSQTPSIWNEMVPAVSVVIIVRSLTGATAIVPLNEGPEVGCFFPGAQGAPEGAAASWLAQKTTSVGDHFILAKNRTSVAADR